ncbi:MAG: uridine phosphorylase [Deltaproteobacteria bacterium]
MPRAYHIRLDKKTLRGAAIALLPGDPARSALIAGFISRRYSTPFKMLASNREFTTHLACINGAFIAVTSTGIGGPSATIAVEELASSGIRTFIRVGTSGSIQDRVKPGDCVITTGSVRLDGSSTHYAPVEYPAISDFSVVHALVEGAKKANIRYHLGITASSATFYPGEERRDSFRKYSIRSIRNGRLEWRKLNVLNYEMESASILVAAGSMGLRAGCVTGVVNAAGDITENALKKGETNAVKTAVFAAEEVIRRGLYE